MKVRSVCAPRPPKPEARSSPHEPAVSRRASVRVQLAPLERLGPARCETAIRTLAAFLDEQGSVGRTAQRLHLHRNAVTYRMRRITSLLGVDLDDPDQRLALQLACRARLLQ